MTDQPLCAIAGVGPGIGFALAKRFAAHGHAVAMIARSADKLRGYAEEIGAAASGHPADLTDATDIRRVFDEIRQARGPIRTLIHNASLWNAQPALTFDSDEFQRDLFLSVTSALVCVQAAAADLRDGGGTVLFTGGGLALFPQAGTPVPSLTVGKAALRAFALALAGELRPQGVPVRTLTVAGTVEPGTPFDPDRIAGAMLALSERGPEDATVEVVFDGRG